MTVDKRHPRSGDSAATADIAFNFAKEGYKQADRMTEIAQHLPGLRKPPPSAPFPQTVFKDASDQPSPATQRTKLERQPNNSFNPQQPNSQKPRVGGFNRRTRAKTTVGQSPSQHPHTPTRFTYDREANAHPQNSTPSFSLDTPHNEPQFSVDGFYYDDFPAQTQPLPRTSARYQNMEVDEPEQGSSPARLTRSKSQPDLTNYDDKAANYDLHDIPVETKQQRLGDIQTNRSRDGQNGQTPQSVFPREWHDNGHDSRSNNRAKGHHPERSQAPNLPPPSAGNAPSNAQFFHEAARILSDTEQKASHFEQEANDLRARLQWAEDEKANLSQQITSLGGEVQSLNTELENIRQAKLQSEQNARNALSGYQSRLVATESLVAEIQTIAEAAKDAGTGPLDEAACLKAELKGELDSVKAAVEAAQLARDRKAQELRQAHAAERNNLKSTIRDLTNSLEVERKQGNKSEQFLKLLKTAFGGDVKGFGDRITALYDSGLVSKEVAGELRKELESRKTELATAHERIDTLESDCAELRLRLETAYDNQEQYANKLRLAEASKAEAMNLNAQLDVIQKSMAKEMAGYQKECNEYKRKLEETSAEHKATLASIRSEEETLREKLAVVTTASEAMQAASKNEQKAASDYKKEADKRMTAYLQEMKEYKDQMTEALETQKMALAQSEERAARLAEIENELKTARKNVAKLDKENAKLQQSLQHSQDTQSSLKEQISQLNEELDEAKSAKSGDNHGAQQAKVKVTELTTRLKDKEAHIKSLTELVKAAQEAREQSAAKLSKANEIIDEQASVAQTGSAVLQSELNELKKEQEELHFKLRKAEGDAEKARREMESAKAANSRGTALSRYHKGELTAEDQEFMVTIEQTLQNDIKQRDNHILELKRKLSKYESKESKGAETPVSVPPKIAGERRATSPLSPDPSVRSKASPSKRKVAEIDDEVEAARLAFLNYESDDASSKKSAPTTKKSAMKGKEESKGKQNATTSAAAKRKTKKQF